MNRIIVGEGYGEPIDVNIGDFHLRIYNGCSLVRLGDTDAANARRLIEVFGTRIRFCEPQGWLLHDGKRWLSGAGRQVRHFIKVIGLALAIVARKLPYSEDEDFDPQKEIGKIGRALQKEHRIKGCLYAAECEPDIMVTPDDLDANPFLFNCLNGTLDLRTGELRDHDPADLITNLADVDFDPDAKCPLFDKFHSQITCGDTNLAGYLQRVLGMAMTGDIREQHLWIFHGPGANGKDTLLDAVANCMGSYQALAAPELLVAKRWSQHPTEVADLIGKRLVVSSETEKSQELRVAFVKQATGGAKLKARFMRGDFFEFPRTHKTILVTNNPPVIAEITRAVWRRIKLVPFFYSIPDDELDQDLPAKLKAEASGILNWLIAGCLEWQQAGLREASAVERATALYREESDVFTRFVQDTELTFGTSYQFKVQAKYVQARRANWCRDTGLMLSPIDLSIGLKNRGCKPYRNKTERGWKGVKFPVDQL